LPRFFLLSRYRIPILAGIPEGSRTSKYPHGDGYKNGGGEAEEPWGRQKEELARRLEIDPSTVTAWEGGAVRRRYSWFVKLFEGYVERV
jgi:hypothetical protein